MFELDNIKQTNLSGRHHCGNIYELQDGVREVSDLFRILKLFSGTAETKTNKILFRGESKEYKYPGITSFARYCLENNITPSSFLPLHDDKHIISCLTKEEFNIVNEFKNSAPENDIFHKLSDGNDRHPDWYAFAQHQGQPTRLLDITKNPLVALYFACKSSANNDGYLFLYFDVWNPLNENKVIDDFEDFFDLALDGELAAYKKENRLNEYFKHKNPRNIPVYMVYESPTLNNRLNAQQGVFLWQYDPFETLNQNNIIIKIKSSEKSSILNELHQIGVNEKGLKLV